jgi:hypothetical protein
MERMEPRAPLCPSALPEMPHGRVFGVVGGTATEPRLAYLDQATEATEDVLALSGPVKPTEVFRMAAPCVESKCTHFDGKDCRLVTRIVQILPAVVDALPACSIRKDCRWFEQEGRSACLRCPQVVTWNCAASDGMVQAATPVSGVLTAADGRGRRKQPSPECDRSAP